MPTSKPIDLNACYGAPGFEPDPAEAIADGICTRIVYRACVGAVPEKGAIHHACGHLWCLNPRHMKLVDIRANRRSV